MKKTALLLCLSFASLLHAESVIQEWDVNGESELRAISPDARYIAVIDHLDACDQIIVIDIKKDVWLDQLVVQGRNMAIAFSPDSQHLLVGQTDGHLQAYDLTTLQKALDVELVRGAAISAIAVSGPHTSEIFISSPKGPSHWAYPSLMRLNWFGPPANAPALTASDNADSWERFISAMTPDASLAVEADVSLKHLRLFNLQARQEVQNKGGLFANQGSDLFCKPHSLYEVVDIPRVGFSSNGSTVIALTVDADESLEWNELDMTGKLISSNHLASVSSYLREAHALSEDGTSILSSFYEAGTPISRGPGTGDCAAWIRNVRNDPDSEILTVTERAEPGTVLLSRDGKIAVTLEPFDKLRVWSLP